MTARGFGWREAATQTQTKENHRKYANLSHIRSSTPGALLSGVVTEQLAGRLIEKVEAGGGKDGVGAT